MDYDRKCHAIAVQMLGYPEGNEGLLNANLCEKLTLLDDMCRRAGGQIISRQIVALAITDFQQNNPGVKLIGD